MKKKKSTHLKKIIGKIPHGLSFHRDATFIPNVVLCIGLVFVWRGLWNLIDIYFYPEHGFLSNTLAIIIGIFLIYLPDNSFSQLGGFSGKQKRKTTLEKEITHDEGLDDSK